MNFFSMENTGARFDESTKCSIASERALERLRSIGGPAWHSHSTSNLSTRLRRGSDWHQARRARRRDLTRLYATWLEYALLVFPGQHLSRDEQVAFARRFGPLEFSSQRSAT